MPGCLNYGVRRRRKLWHVISEGHVHGRAAYVTELAKVPPAGASLGGACTPLYLATVVVIVALVKTSQATVLLVVQMAPSCSCTHHRGLWSPRILPSPTPSPINRLNLHFLRCRLNAEYIRHIHPNLPIFHDPQASAITTPTPNFAIATTLATIVRRDHK